VFKISRSEIEDNLLHKVTQYEKSTNILSNEIILIICNNILSNNFKNNYMIIRNFKLE